MQMLYFGHLLHRNRKQYVPRHDIGSKMATPVANYGVTSRAASVRLGDGPPGGRGPRQPPHLPFGPPVHFRCLLPGPPRRGPAAGVGHLPLPVDVRDERMPGLRPAPEMPRHPRVDGQRVRAHGRVAAAGRRRRSVRGRRRLSLRVLLPGHDRRFLFGAGGPGAVSLPGLLYGRVRRLFREHELSDPPPDDTQHLPQVLSKAQVGGVFGAVGVCG